MAQIQKEEEAKKRRLVVAAAQAQAAAIGSIPSPAGGKSYANLAGKTITAPTGQQANAGGAWTTVGASGKMKTPVAPPTPAGRAVSSGVVPTVQATIRKAPSRSSTLNTAGAVNAQEEFRKWAVGELRPDLNKGISGKSFHACYLRIYSLHDSDQCHSR